MGRLRMTQTVVPLLVPSNISSGPLATEDPVQDESDGNVQVGPSVPLVPVCYQAVSLELDVDPRKTHH